MLKIVNHGLLGRDVLFFRNSKIRKLETRNSELGTRKSHLTAATRECARAYSMVWLDGAKVKFSFTLRYCITLRY